MEPLTVIIIATCTLLVVLKIVDSIYLLSRKEDKAANVAMLESSYKMIIEADDRLKTSNKLLDTSTEKLVGYIQSLVPTITKQHSYNYGDEVTVLLKSPSMADMKVLFRVIDSDDTDVCLELDTEMADEQILRSSGYDIPVWISHDKVIPVN